MPRGINVFAMLLAGTISLMISNSTHVPYWAQALARSSLVYAASVLIYSQSFEPERPGSGQRSGSDGSAWDDSPWFRRC